MPFKCNKCGLSFDEASEFMKHKLTHQGESEKQDKKALVCLSCGESIPDNYLKQNYTGDIVCQNCKQTIRIIIQNGEVLFAMSKGRSEQTREELLIQYPKWILEYVKARDIIEELVPVPDNLTEGVEMKPVKVTEDLLAKFQYAESTMITALRNRQEIHKKLLSLLNMQ